MAFCILSEANIQVFEQGERNRLIKELELEKDVNPTAEQLQEVEANVVKHIELLRCMIDLPSADDLTAEGGLFAKDKGGNYTGSIVFNKVQYNAFKRSYPERAKQKGVWIWFQRICSPIWSLLGTDGKGRWNAVATSIKAMERNKEVKIFSRSVTKQKCFCPFCFHDTSDANERHMNVHFPDRATNDDQKQFSDDLDRDLVADSNLPETFNAKCTKFWESLFMEESERSQELNQEIGLCEQLVAEALSVEGAKGLIYCQVQDPSAAFTCNQGNLTEVLKYTGKSLKMKDMRYFNGNSIISGRVGEEHIRSIRDKVKVYFWAALQDVPLVSYAAFEIMLIMALLQLDHAKKSAWNVGVVSIPRDQKFKSDNLQLRDNNGMITWRNVDPKIQIKVGLVLWRQILNNFQQSVNDESLFKSQELLTYCATLNEVGQDNYIKRCGGDKVRETAENSRFAKKQKRTAQEPTKTLENAQEYSAVTQLNQAHQFARQHFAAIQLGVTYTQDQLLNMMSQMVGLTQLPQ